MHIQRTQPHGKVSSYSTQTISGSAQSKVAQQMQVPSKADSGAYSQRTGQSNGVKPYKVYKPFSSKGRSVNPNYYSPHSKKTQDLHSSKVSQQSNPRQNLSGMFKYSHRVTPRKHNDLGRGLSGLSRSGSNKQVNVQGTHGDSESSAKYSFHNRRNGDSRVVTNGSDQQSTWTQSRQFEHSSIKNSNNTMFSSNRRHGSNFFANIESPLVQNVHKNQFRPGGRLGELYKPQIKTLNPVKLNYASNKNVYEHLASNSFPKNLNEKKSASHRSNLHIREINPFKKKTELYSINRENGNKVETKKVNAKYVNHTPRESNPITQNRKFQLGNMPFQNVYENRRWEGNSRKRPDTKAENPYAFQNVLGSNSIKSNYSQSEARKSNSRMNSAPKYFNVEDNRSRSRSNSHVLPAQYSQAKKNDPASFLSSNSFSRNQPRNHFQGVTDSTENENFYVNIRKMRESTDRSVGRREPLMSRKTCNFRTWSQGRSQWVKSEEPEERANLNREQNWRLEQQSRTLRRSRANPKQAAAQRKDSFSKATWSERDAEPAQFASEIDEYDLETRIGTFQAQAQEIRHGRLEEFGFWQETQEQSTIAEHLLKRSEFSFWKCSESR